MMTAVWASPIVRRTCSPMGERSRRTVGSSSSMRASAGPILSRSPFETGSMATTSDGIGNSSGGRVSGAAWADSVSPVSVTVSLAIAPISPAFSSPMGSCSLPCSSSSWPIRSSAPWVAFQMWACEWSVPDRTRRYVSRPTNGSAVVLKTRTRSGPSSSAATSTVVAGLVRGLDRRLVGGRGQVAHDRIEQAAQADALRRAAEQHRRQDRLLDALAQAGLELRVADRLALEVLREDVVIGFGGGFEELVAPGRDLVGEVGRDRDLHLGLAVPLVGLVVDQVHVALERVGGPDGELERRDLVAERRPQLVERGRRDRRSRDRTC